MIKIRLNRIEEHKNLYTVFLDSENKYKFESRRKADEFLRLVSSRLTDSLVFINTDYAYVHDLYRQYYFLIEDFQLRFEIENSLEFIRNKMALLLFVTAGENRNTLVISGIENMLFELKAVYTSMNRIIISRKSDTGIRHIIATKTRIVDLFLMDFKRFEDKITVSRSEIVVNHDVKLRKVI